MKIFSLKIFTIAFLAVVLAAIGIVLLVQHQSLSNAPEKLPAAAQQVAATTTLVSFTTSVFTGAHTKIEYAYSTKYIESSTTREYIDIQYPQFYGAAGLAGLNASVEKQVMDRLEYSRQQVDYSKPICFDPTGEGLCFNSVDLTARYQVIAIVKGIISIEFVFTDFTGGGNGNHDEPLTFLYDLQDQKVVQQQDLYCDSTSADKLFAIAADKIDAGDVAFESEYNGMFPTPVSMSDWDQYVTSFGDLASTSSLEQDSPGLILASTSASLVFPPYSFFSGAFGIVRVPMSYAELQGILCLP